MGILGVQDLLGSGVVRIDYRRGVINRHRDSSDDGDPIVFINGKAILGVEGHVVGAEPGLFLIDTGGRRSTFVDEYVNAALDGGASWSVSAPETVEVRALGRANRERRFVASSRWCSRSTNACIDLSNTPVDTTPADAGTVQVGKLGADAFAGRVLELDYVSCRVRLE